MNDDKNEKPEDADRSKGESPFMRALRLGAARATSPLDQKIMELKEIWDWMLPQDRLNLKEWIERLVPVEKKPVSSLMGSVEISLRYPRQAQDGDNYDLAVDGMKPTMMAEAIAAWEKGQDFAPGMYEILR